MTTTDATEGLSLPELPVIDRCLIIDASFQSRRQLLNAVKASCLFETIDEAKSLADALANVQFTKFDICILGPSISVRNKAEFIAECGVRALAKDCAYVSVLTEMAIAIADEVKAHASVRYGGSKQLFCEAVIRGMLRANNGTRWPGVRLDSDGNILIVRKDGVWEQWGGREEIPAAKQPSVEFVESLTEACAPAAKDHSQSQVRKIIEKLLTQVNDPQIEMLEADEFTRFVYAALQDWQIEMEFSSEREATKSLKAKLLNFNRKLATE